MNLGAFLAPLVCGTVGEIYGWHWGFGLAGIGMVVGLITYLGGGRYLPKTNDVAPIETARARNDGPSPARTYLLFLLVIAIVVIFRASYEQSGNTIASWTDSGVDRHVGHLFTIPMTWFQSLNPLFIFLLTPVVVIYWTRAARRGRVQSTVAKMATGAFIVGASYFLLAAIAAWAGPERTSWAWLVLYFLVCTVGELFILPVGLSLFGRLAPKAFAATAIAAWFIAAFFGNLLAGVVGTLWSSLTPAMFFIVAGALGSTAGALLLWLAPWARKVESDAVASAA